MALITAAISKRLCLGLVDKYRNPVKQQHGRTRPACRAVLGPLSVSVLSAWILLGCTASEQTGEPDAGSTSGTTGPADGGTNGTWPDGLGDARSGAAQTDGSTLLARDGSANTRNDDATVGFGNTDGGPGAGADGSTPEGSACPQTLLGWASIEGDGLPTTTGGGTTTPVRAHNAQELQSYASDDTPRVIEIEGNLDVPHLQVGSNKTLVGVGANATIRGGIRIRGSADTEVHNVIVRNLRINGKTTEADGDALQLYFAHHVWIDHCEIWDGPDGNLDMTHAVNWVTVSWTKFRYTPDYVRPSGESADHRFSSLIGHSDGNASEDSGRLKVSFHHNQWGERVLERMPRVRFGQVHVFNNYFHAPGNNYCVRAGRGAQLLVEGNYFHAVQSPHEFNSTSDEATAHITARNNVYDTTTGGQATGGGGTALASVPYAAPIEPAAGIPALVGRCAGPR